MALHDALNDFASSLGITRKLREYNIVTSWDDIVGTQIGRVAKPQRIERGVLFVAVASAPWRAELSMRRREIIQRINDSVGKKVILDIRFR